MPGRWWGRAGALALAWAIGCGGPSQVDGGTSADAGTDAGATSVDSGPGDGGTDAGAPIAIPSPGAFMDRWTLDGLEIGPGHGSPSTAFQVGTVTMSPFYIGATLDAVTGDAFWVFQTGPGVTTLDIALRGGDINLIDFMHLHDGAAMQFGAEIAPDTYDVQEFQILASWSLVENHVYVLEVHGSMGSFF